jgi:hypothetical protein
VPVLISNGLGTPHHAWPDINRRTDTYRVMTWGTKLSKIVGKHGAKTAQAYVRGNREGQEWIIRHCDAHGLALQREDAYTYAQSANGVSSVGEELEAAKAAGLDAEWVDEAAVPFPFHGGVRLVHQAQFDPCHFWTA